MRQRGSRRLKYLGMLTNMPNFCAPQSPWQLRLRVQTAEQHFSLKVSPSPLSLASTGFATPSLMDETHRIETSNAWSHIQMPITMDETHRGETGRCWMVYSKKLQGQPNKTSHSLHNLKWTELRNISATYIQLRCFYLVSVEIKLAFVDPWMNLYCGNNMHFQRFSALEST